MGETNADFGVSRAGTCPFDIVEMRSFYTGGSSIGRAYDLLRLRHVENGSLQERLMLNGRSDGFKQRAQRLLVMGVVGAGTGVVFLFCIVYAVAALQSGQLDAQHQLVMGVVGAGTGVVFLFCIVYAVVALQRSQLGALTLLQRAHLGARAQRRRQQQARPPQPSVAVTTMAVAAGEPFDASKWELRDVGGASRGALRSLDELQGKVLWQSVESGYTVIKSDLYEPADLLAAAEIIHAEIGPATVTLGATLTISVTVKNTSGNTVKTTGPNPGHTYEMGENYRQNSGVRDEHSGPEDSFQYFAVWRVALGSTRTGEHDFPYRWGLGTDLAPGQTTTVTGQIKINRYFEPSRFWVALIREPDGVMEDGVGVTVVTSLPQRIVDQEGR
jgi:hypothetical protein